MGTSFAVGMQMHWITWYCGAPLCHVQQQSVVTASVLHPCLRFRRRVREFGKLEYVRTLLGYDAHSPAYASHHAHNSSMASSLDSVSSTTSSSMHRAALLGSGSGSGGVATSGLSRNGSTQR